MGPLWSEILDVKHQHPHQFLSLFSAHDSTIYPLLLSLGGTKVWNVSTDFPPYASMMILEVNTYGTLFFLCSSIFRTCSVWCCDAFGNRTNFSIDSNSFCFFFFLFLFPYIHIFTYIFISTHVPCHTIYIRTKFHDVYNVDEVGVFTLKRPPRASCTIQ